MKTDLRPSPAYLQQEAILTGILASSARYCPACGRTLKSWVRDGRPVWKCAGDASTSYRGCGAEPIAAPDLEAQLAGVGGMVAR